MRNAISLSSRLAARATFGGSRARSPERFKGSSARGRSGLSRRAATRPGKVDVADHHSDAAAEVKKFSTPAAENLHARTKSIAATADPWLRVAPFRARRGISRRPGTVESPDDRRHEPRIRRTLNDLIVRVPRRHELFL
jgi:hypothetical protein